MDDDSDTAEMAESGLQADEANDVVATDDLGDDVVEVSTEADAFDGDAVDDLPEADDVVDLDDR